MIKLGLLVSDVLARLARRHLNEPIFLRQASKETSSEADKDGCTDAAEAGPSLHA